jgi:predicted acyl esterase
VRWAAALPGSNGAVGMIGVSYFGNTQWMAALSKPPELKAIAPLITWSQTAVEGREDVLVFTTEPLTEDVE